MSYERFFYYYKLNSIAFSVLTLLVWRQEEN